METKIQTSSGKLNPELIARKFEQLAKQIRNSKHLSGTFQTTPYDAVLTITNGTTVLNLSTTKGGAL